MAKDVTKGLDTAHFKALLLARKAELGALSAEAADDVAPVALDQQAVGRVSRIDSMQRQAMAQAQERQRRHELVRIEQGLTRIADADYGYCADCGEPIAKGRLEADPAAALCVSCAGRS